MTITDLDNGALKDILSSAIENWGVPGAACAVWQKGKLVKASAGVLNIANGHKVQDDSLLQIGSITKVITATVVMILVDKGLIDLDAPVRTYIPELKLADLESAQTVTVRQLLNHTNGMAGDFMPDTGMGRDRLERFLDCCRLLPQSHPVGQGFSYSNAAYCIAGLVIERTARLPFDQAVKELLFDSMGLKNSIISPLDAVGRSVAMGHVPDSENDGYPKPVGNIYALATSTSPAGATCMMSTADMVAFARMHLAGGIAPNGERILSEKSVAEMQRMDTKIPVPQRDISHWGLGWFFGATTDTVLFGHDGGTIGQYSFLRIHAESETVVILLTNGGTYTDCMIEVFEQTLEPLTGFKHSPAPVSRPELPDNVERFTGRFKTVATVTDIRFEDGKLLRNATMTLDGAAFPEPEVELEYVGEDTFQFRRPGASYPASVTFMEPDEDGVPQVMFFALRVARRER